MLTHLSHLICFKCKALNLRSARCHILFGNIISHQGFEDLRRFQFENEDEALAKVLKMSKPEDSPTPLSLVLVSFEYP